MYRDDPLDDEFELREIVGDEAVDFLAEAEERAQDPVEVAVDVLRVLQGWVDDEAAGRWFHQPQRRLEGRRPLDALAAGAFEEVTEAASAWAAAQG
jgi:uncharacterized protein (DUF2384 family)